MEMSNNIPISIDMSQDFGVGKEDKAKLQVKNWLVFIQGLSCAEVEGNVEEPDDNG